MKCNNCNTENKNGQIYCELCNATLPYSDPDKEIKKSKCCNAEIKYVKGSFMGSFDRICTRCEKYTRENN